MDDHYKICGNCGYATMAGGDLFVCIDPSKPAHEFVRMGERRPCFVVTALTQDQTTAAARSPDVGATIQ